GWGSDGRALGTLRSRASRLAIGAASAGIALALGMRFLAHSVGGAGAAGAAATSAPASTLTTSDALGRLPGALVFALRRLVWPWPVPVFHARVPAIGPGGVLGALL